MTNPTEKEVLRARDFWGALVLFVVSFFFLWRTSFIPLWGENRAGVSGGDWYNSAAIVPLGIFTGLLILSLVLLRIAIKEGGAKIAFTSVGLGWDRTEAWRFFTLAVVLFFYIAGLVPRVDFVICSGLMITVLIYGYHGGHLQRMTIAMAFIAIPGLFSMILYLPRSEWNVHNDDIVALVFWIVLTFWILIHAKGDKVARAIPMIAIIAPLILVLAMAFGFRQNVPNRGGLFFKQIEYHYFVNIKPLWSR